MYCLEELSVTRKLKVDKKPDMVEETREAYVVEDWNISRLQTGQAIIGLPGSQPFLFQFDRYPSR